MRLLAREGARLATENLSECAVIEGLVFARLAYARTGNLGDAGLILGLLGLACGLVGEGEELRESWEAEGVALISLLADEGVDAADAALPLAMQEVSQEAAMLAGAVPSQGRAGAARGIVADPEAEEAQFRAMVQNLPGNAGPQIPDMCAVPFPRGSRPLRKKSLSSLTLVSAAALPEQCGVTHSDRALR